jgi:hypothetical protein
MQIDERDEQQENTLASIRKGSEPASNVTLESEQHPWKHHSQSMRTDAGMQIDESDEQS